MTNFSSSRFGFRSDTFCCFRPLSGQSRPKTPCDRTGLGPNSNRFTICLDSRCRTRTRLSKFCAMSVVRALVYADLHGPLLFDARGQALPALASLSPRTHHRLLCKLTLPVEFAKTFLVHTRAPAVLEFPMPLGHSRTEPIALEKSKAWGGLIRQSSAGSLFLRKPKGLRGSGRKHYTCLVTNLEWAHPVRQHCGWRFLIRPPRPGSLGPNTRSKGETPRPAGPLNTRSPPRANGAPVACGRAQRLWDADGLFSVINVSRRVKTNIRAREPGAGQ